MTIISPESTNSPHDDFEDRISIRAEDDTTSTSLPNPGPMAIFVVLAAIAVGLVAALLFSAVAPDTTLIILGGTLLGAAILGVIGLYRYEWFLLITLTIRPALDDLIADQFGTFQPSAILGILVIGVSLLHLISRKMSGNWTPLTPLGWAFIGFFVLFLPSFVTSVDRGVSQAALFGLASVMLIYLAIEQKLQEDRKFLYRLLAATGIGLVVPIVVGFVQFFFTGTLDPGGSGLVRIDGSFAHPNTFATYLSFVILISISLIPVMTVERKLLAFTVSGIGMFLLVATFARGAWASFLIGTLVLAARINKKAVFGIIGGAALVGVGVPGVRGRIENLFATTGANGGVKTDDSLAWRLGYWERIAPFFNRNPVTGLGIDATKTQTPEGKDPHNSFLQAFLEGGIIGGVGFLLLLAVAAYAGRKVWQMARRDELDPRIKLISVGAIAALMSVAAQLITENVLLNTIVWWYLNIAFALLAVLTWGKRTKDTHIINPEADSASQDFSMAALPAGQAQDTTTNPVQ